MSYQFIDFYRGQYCKWKWPMRIGVIQQTDEERLQLISNYWPSKFCKVDNIGQEETLYNLILCKGNLESISNAILESKAQSVLILIQEEESFFQNETKKKESENLLLALSKHTEGFAALFFHTSENLSDWFNRFVIDICHNQTIRESLEHTTQNIFGFYDYELDYSAKLSFLLQKSIRILESHQSSFPDTYEFKSKLIPQKKMSIHDLLQELESRLEHAHFNHESDEATGIAELFESVEKELDINIADAREFYASAPPPQSGAEPEDENDEVENDEETGSDGSDDFDDTSPSPAPMPSPSPIDNLEDLLDQIDNYIPPHDENKMDGGFNMQIEDVFDITGRGTVVSKPTEKPSPNKPRYLQTAFRNISNQQVNCLFQSNAYKLVVRIGAYNRDWTQSKKEDIFPDQEVFKDPNSTTEKINILVKDSLTNTIQSSEITLNKSGDSNEAIFNFITDQQNKKYQAEIYAYHKDRLIQKATLTAEIMEEGEDPNSSEITSLTIDLKIISELSNLSSRTQFMSSIGSNTPPQIDQPIIGISKNKPLLSLNFSSGLEKLMKSIKNRIQNAAINVDDFPEDLYAEENQTLLLQLALDGNDLYINHLKDTIDIKGPIQIICQKDEFIPFDFVYTYSAPHKDAHVCEHAADALLKGTCCGCDAIKEFPCDIICPFGFLGMREIIEHHSTQSTDEKLSSDYIVMAEPSSQRKPLSILRNTLYAASDKVFAAKPSLLQDIQTAFKQNTQHSIEVGSWDEWSSKLQTENPDSLILLVHIEPEEKTTKYQVEIGHADFRGKNLINKKMIQGASDQNHPFVMMIGCEAVNMDEFGFDLSSQLMNVGAAMVMSNFTKIRGRQAAPIVIKMLEFLKANEGKEFTLGEIVLKLRQYLLAKGIMVGFSITTFGDADWKIKI